MQNCVDRHIAVNEPLPEILLPKLFEKCRNSDAVVKSFLLASACREAVSHIVKQRENKTYGKVWKVAAVKPWDKLLRKIRVTLLFDLEAVRHSARSVSPLTVENLENSSIFSMHQVVARDEQSSSHKHDELVALEDACRNSGLIFDPNSRAIARDKLVRWKILQQGCLANSITEAERTEYLVELETEVQGALLLYVPHANRDPQSLCAHRALC